MILEHHHTCEPPNVFSAETVSRLAYLNISQIPQLGWLRVCPAPISQRQLLAVANCWASSHQAQAPVITKGVCVTCSPEIRLHICQWAVAYPTSFFPKESRDILWISQAKVILSNFRSMLLQYCIPFSLKNRNLKVFVGLFFYNDDQESLRINVHT